MSQRILVVDDEPKLAALLAETLAAPGREVVKATSAQAGWTAFAQGGADLVITDLRMESEEAGLGLIERVRKTSPDTPCILVTAFASIEAGVRALELGALEYLVKPVRLRALRESVDRLLAPAGQEALAVATEGEIAGAFDDILVGKHPGMRRILELLPRVVASDSNVLIIGESGTGKEVLARAIHGHGPRKQKPFVRVNCAALVESLLEAELFGIEAGVATDVKARPGKFELAGPVELRGQAERQIRGQRIQLQPRRSAELSSHLQLHCQAGDAATDVQPQVALNRLRPLRPGHGKGIHPQFQRPLAGKIQAAGGDRRAQLGRAQLQRVQLQAGMAPIALQLQ